MTGRNVQHDTIVAERRLAAPPARVFAAFSDPAERARWDVPGDDWVIESHEQDFRVGGREAQRFGPKGNAHLHSEGRFLEIVPGERYVSAGVMHDNDVPMTATLLTVEVYPDGSGTRLILTDQSAFLGRGERPEDRRQGWNEILDKLEAYLAGRHVRVS
jgi:uncharacterized protein YndB with AHSA1/START domain